MKSGLAKESIIVVVIAQQIRFCGVRPVQQVGTVRIERQDPFMNVVVANCHC